MRFVQGRPIGAKRLPKVSQNGSPNRSRGSSGLDFVFFLILMPLPHGIAVFMVPGHSKIDEKTFKHTHQKLSRFAFLGTQYENRRKSCPKVGPRPWGTNCAFRHFFALGSPMAPQERPRVPKVSPRECRESQLWSKTDTNST